MVIMQVVYSIKARIPPPRKGEDDTRWDLWPRNILWAIFTAAEISAKCLRLTRQPSFACKIFSNANAIYDKKCPIESRLIYFSKHTMLLSDQFYFKVIKITRIRTFCILNNTVKFN